MSRALRLPFPKIGGSQPPPKTAIANITGTCEATEFKIWPVMDCAVEDDGSLVNVVIGARVGE